MRMLEGVPVSEYAKRRERVLKSLKGAIGVVFSGDGAPPLRGSWEPDSDFLYLTGIRSEAGAAVVFDASQPNPDRRILLLLRPVDSEADVWDGYRDLISEGLREKTGFSAVMRSKVLPYFLRDGAARCKRLACLHPLAMHTQPVSKDLEIFQKLAARVPGCSIEDRSDLITRMRMIKSAAEIKELKAAIDATRTGMLAVFAASKGGVSERHLFQELIRGFESHGSERPGFDPIVGSGIRSTILHYKDNDQIAQDGDICVLDCGAEINGYGADITRAFPINGKFSAEQRKVYNTVLKAQEASIRATKPGATMYQVERAARAVIEKAGYGDAMPHGIGHHLGMETHDPGLAHEPLKAGMVITIEPGIYLPDEEIGVRIEDDILVTKDGRRNLSSSVPKTVAEIEKAMKG